MSSINISSSNEMSSCLSDKYLLKNKKPIIERNTSCLYSNSLKKYECKNIFNKINLFKLKGKDKYQNYLIFEKRELEFDKNKKKRLNLTLKKSSSLSNNIHDTSTNNPIYITQNIIKGDYTKLPLLLQTINNNKLKNKIQTVNNSNKLISVSEETNLSNEKKYLNKSCEEIESRNNNVRLLFLNKLKNNIEKKELNKRPFNKAKSYILKKKNMILNTYRMPDKSISNHISRLHEFLISKQNCDLKNEQLLQIIENNKNELEKINNTIKAIHKYNKMYDEKFFAKYNEYFRILIIEKDKLNNYDLLLCKYIYSLKSEIKMLENKIKKIINEKNTYIKWMILQIRIKEKLLNLPKQYIEILKEGKKNNKNINPENNRLLKYTNNIIYNNPDEIHLQLKQYENQNLKLVIVLNNIIEEINLLKNELKKQEYENINNYFIKEINRKDKIKKKLIEHNKILNNHIKLLKQNNKSIHNYPYNKNKYSKLYEKMKMLRANVVGKGVTITNPSEKINEEREMLKIIKEIDINADICLKKQKIYSEKYKKKYEQQKEILEQFKKRERIRLHQKKLNDKFIKLKEKIIQKSNKIYFLPNRKINFRNDCLNKECQSYLVNNKKEREQQDNFKDYIHSVNKSEESEEVNE